MWIKTQSGKIYNGDAIASFELETVDVAGSPITASPEGLAPADELVRWLIIGQTFEFGSKIQFGEYETREAALIRLNSFFGAEDHGRNFDFT